MPRNGHPSIRRAIPSLARLPRRVFSRAESLPSGSWAPEHRHDWVQLSYALSGVLAVRTAGGSFIAPPQRAIWIPAGVEHQVTTSSRAEMRSLYIERGACARQDEACEVLEVTPLARELIKAASTLGPDYDEDGAAGRLVSVLLDEIAALHGVAFNLPMPGDARLQRLCAALQAAPHDGRTLGQWGREVGLTERSIARLFVKETGLSFGDWRLRLRMLLSLGPLETGASVTRVALDMGYASTSAFIAAFRRVFGTTPREMFARGERVEGERAS